jgi:protein CpxP
MDIFKQNRYLWFAIIILLIMNFAAITLLWLGRPEGRRPQSGPPDPVEEKTRTEQMLQKELGFDKIQTEQYLMMRQEHSSQAQQLDDEIRQLKKQMFDEVLEDSPQPLLSDSLLRLVQEKQANLEQVTFQHFVDLKKLCKPEQRDNLKLLMREVFRQKSGPRDDGMPPPPPPGDDLPPPPPKD